MSIRQSNPGGFIKPGFDATSAALGTTTFYYLYAWGADEAGQLGVRNTTNQSSPVQVASASLTWSKIVSGGGTTLAIKSNGTLWGWGENSNGQLGLGNTISYSSPKQVGALTTWASIAGNNQVGMGITTGGQLWSWGSNTFSTLGGGSSRSSPVQIGTDTNWLQVVCGGYFNAFAIKTNGTLWAWGFDNTSALGRGYLLGLNNTTLYSFNSPVQVGGDTNWSSIFTQGNNCFNSLFVKSTGTLWGWGTNVQGQLGVGDTTGRRSPIQIGALSNWSTGATTFKQVAALKTDGSLWSWGDGSLGILGLNNTTSYSSPKNVGGYDWLKIIGGGYNFVALKTNETLWAWGNNGNGQLGLGNTTNYSSPKQIGSSNHWGGISARSNSCFAF